MSTPPRPTISKVSPVWLTEAEAAVRLNMSQKWLQKVRQTGGGPEFAKFGSSVRYPIVALEEYERQSLRRSTSDFNGRGLGK